MLFATRKFTAVFTKRRQSYPYTQPAESMPSHIIYLIIILTFSSRKSIVFFLVSWGGVRLSPLGRSVTNWHIAPAPDDR
jgi:hypothetical protein